MKCGIRWHFIRVCTLFAKIKTNIHVLLLFLAVPRVGLLECVIVVLPVTNTFDPDLNKNNVFEVETLFY